MIHYFATAAGRSKTLWEEPDFYTRLSHGAIDTDPDDMCEPITTTTVVQITDWGYARALRDTLTFRADPDEKGKVASVEDCIAETLANFLAPPTHCWCAHDCCGCRTGSFTVRHVGGAVFLCQSHTSRNY